GQAHTRRAVVLRLAEALARHLPLRRVELALAEEEGVALVMAVAEEGRLDVSEEARAEPLSAGFEPRVARKGGSLVVTIPLVEGEDLPAQVTLALGAAMLPEDLLGAMGRVIAASVRHIRLVERVASLSRRAHAESAGLKKRLEAALGGEEIVARSDAMLRVLE